MKATLEGRIMHVEIDQRATDLLQPGSEAQ